MGTKDFTTSITLHKTASEAFDAINNVRGWWHGEIEGNTDALNDEFDYRFEHFHYSRQKVTELIPGKRIVWLVTDSNLGFTENKSEWTGTRIIFDITETNGNTEIRFTHEGLVPSFECYSDCSNGWTMLVQQSLQNLLTEGKGVEVFG